MTISISTRIALGGDVVPATGFAGALGATNTVGETSVTADITLDRGDASIADAAKAAGKLTHKLWEGTQAKIQYLSEVEQLEDEAPRLVDHYGAPLEEKKDEGDEPAEKGQDEWEPVELPEPQPGDIWEFRAKTDGLLYVGHNDGTGSLPWSVPKVHNVASADWFNDEDIVLIRRIAEDPRRIRQENPGDVDAPVNTDDDSTEEN